MMKFNNNAFKNVPFSIIIQIMIYYYVKSVGKIVKYAMIVKYAKFVKKTFSFIRGYVSLVVLLECGAIIIKHHLY